MYTKMYIEVTAVNNTNRPFVLYIPLDMENNEVYYRFTDSKPPSALLPWPGYCADGLRLLTVKQKFKLKVVPHIPGDIVDP